jgi:hypothetical protein
MTKIIITINVDKEHYNNFNRDVNDFLDNLNLSEIHDVKVNEGITDEKIKKALQILEDNGIDKDECEVVLQALGYALLDEELFEEN